LKKGSCEKIGNMPLTLPSPVTPRREEGKYIEIQEEIPSRLDGGGTGPAPRRVQGKALNLTWFRGGGENGIFPHLQGGKRGFSDDGYSQ
jgi:hypothetical protein